MREIRYIHKLSGKWSTDRIGNKAQSLLFLQKKSFPVPLTWIVTSDAHQKFMQEGLPFMDRLRAELSGLPDLTFAIRSSTDLEDAKKLSYAGQFRTELHVRGKDRILQSIINIWESSGKDKVDVYPEEKNEMTLEIRFAIIIQEMVVPVLSGVGFSRNPVSNLNETIVEAVEGTGEDLLQKGITPMRWRIRGEKLLEGDSLNPFFPVIRKVISAIRVLKKNAGRILILSGPLTVINSVFFNCGVSQVHRFSIFIPAGWYGRCYPD